MSAVLIVRTEEEKASEQLPQVATAQPLPYWPLPATRAPGAHFTWDEWVARLAAQTARQQRPVVR